MPARARDRAAGERNDMLTRTPNAPGPMSQRAMAQRRIRRTSVDRLFCSTNGCATYMVLDEEARQASCPICGLRRRIGEAGAREARRPH